MLVLVVLVSRVSARCPQAHCARLRPQLPGVEVDWLVVVLVAMVGLVFT